MQTKGSKEFHVLTFTGPRAPQALRIDTDGGSITITRGLVATNGRERTRVEASAVGDRFAGERPWWFNHDINGGSLGIVGWFEKEEDPKAANDKKVEQARKLFPEQFKTYGHYSGWNRSAWFRLVSLLTGRILEVGAKGGVSPVERDLRAWAEKQYLLAQE